MATTTKSRTASAKKKASGAARKAATGAAKSAAKGAAKSAAKGANKAVIAGGERVGRGTRWTEEQVRLLLETVNASETAKDAFEKVAAELDKSAGTVAQKYYNLQKAAAGGAGTGARRPGRPKGSTSATAARSGSLPTAAQLRGVTVDELTSLASLVRDEIDRRRTELEQAARMLKG